MSKTPKAQHVRIGEHDMVAMSPDDYHRLHAVRRQMGAQSARMRVLKSDLNRALTRLAQIEAVIRKVTLGHAADACGREECTSCILLKTVDTASSPNGKCQVKCDREPAGLIARRPPPRAG